jgi:hypothetical protein
VNGQHVQYFVDQEYNQELDNATTQHSTSMESLVHSLNFKINLVATITVSIPLKIIVINFKVFIFICLGLKPIYFYYEKIQL